MGTKDRGRLSDMLARKPVMNLWHGSVVTFFIVFVLLPTVFVLSYVFTGWNEIRMVVLSDPAVMDQILHAISISFGIATIVTIIDLIAGLPMAWILVRKNFWGKKYLDVLIDVPLAVPTAALGFSTALFWAVTPGVEAFGSLSLFSSPFLLIILLHVVFSYPYMVRSLSAILHEIDKNYEVAASTLGASPFTAARTITLPLFRAGLVTGIILCFARSLSETGGTMIALSMLWPGMAETAFPMHTGPSLIGAWKHAGDMEPQLAFVAIVLILLALLLLVIVKLVVMKVNIPLRKVFPGPERLLSHGLAPKMKDILSFVFLIVVLIIPSFFIIGFVAGGQADVAYDDITLEGPDSFVAMSIPDSMDTSIDNSYAVTVTTGSNVSVNYTIGGVERSIRFMEDGQGWFNFTGVEMTQVETPITQNITLQNQDGTVIDWLDEPGLITRKNVDWDQFWSAMSFSFLVAAVVTMISLLFGVPLAIMIVRGKNEKFSHILDVLVNVPLIVPTSALGISLMMFWGNWNIGIPLLLVISAHIAFTFPLVVRNTIGALEELDPTYEETARTLGAKPMQVFRKVMFPVINMSILAGAIMAFTRSLGETGATLAVVDNANTIPVYIVGLVKSGSYYPAALACLVLIVVSFAAMMVMRYITKKAK